MNKKIIALLLAGMMLLCMGCRKDDVDPNETTSSTENQMDTEVTEGNESQETVPGTAENVLDPDGFEETTEGENSGVSAGGNGTSGNGGSSTGGNGQSGTGSGNTGSNSGGSVSTGNQESSGNGQTSGNNSGSTGSNGQSNSGSANTGSSSGNTGNSGNSGSNGSGNSGSSNAEQSTEPSSGIQYVTYEVYNNMAPTEQMAYYEQFPSMAAFVNWFNEAKAAYDAEHGAIDVGDGNIDLGEIVKP